MLSKPDLRGHPSYPPLLPLKSGKMSSERQFYLRHYNLRHRAVHSQILVQSPLCSALRENAQKRFKIKISEDFTDIGFTKSQTQISRDQTDHVTSKTQMRIYRHNHHSPHTLIVRNCDLLGVKYCVNFSVHTITKKVHKPLLNFLVHAKVDQYQV